MNKLTFGDKVYGVVAKLVYMFLNKFFKISCDIKVIYSFDERNESQKKDYLANERDKCLTLGTYTPSIDTIHIFIDTIKIFHKRGDWFDIFNQVMETTAHEMRHAWQAVYRKDMIDHSIVYYDRPHEKDARRFAEKFMGGFYMIFVAIVFICLCALIAFISISIYKAFM